MKAEPWDKIIGELDGTITAQRARIVELEKQLAAMTAERDRLRKGLTCPQVEEYRTSTICTAED